MILDTFRRNCEGVVSKQVQTVKQADAFGAARMFHYTACLYYNTTHRVLTGSSIQLYWHSGTVVLLHNFITLVLYLFVYFCAVMERNNVDQTV